MIRAIAAAIGLALAAPAGAYVDSKEAPEIFPGLLAFEASRPADAPAPGETLWDEVQGVVARLRAARRAQPPGKGAARLAELERVYSELTYPGIIGLAQGFDGAHFMTTFLGTALKERELHALLAEEAREGRASPGFVPRRGSLEAIERHRQAANESAVKAESLLSEALERVRVLSQDRGPAPARPAPSARLLLEAERSLEAVLPKAVDLAARLRELTGRDQPYAAAIRRTGELGGAAGTGASSPAQRQAAVEAVTAATRAYVGLEYRLASDIGEVRVLPYLLDRQARLAGGE